MHRGIGTTAILIPALVLWMYAPRAGVRAAAPQPRDSQWHGLEARGKLGQDARATPAGNTLSHQQRISVLNDALALFDRGMSLLRSNPTEATRSFQDAAAKFQALIDSGVRNGKLYYNLGNAELQLGHIGRAILNYRRAQKLIPGDERLAANLRFARSQRRNRIAESGESQLFGTLFFLHYKTSLRTRFLAGIACYAAFWAILILRMFRRRSRLGYLAALLAFAWLSLGTSVGVEWTLEGRRPAGVILANDVTVRKGNGESYDPQFQQLLHEGVEFEVIESRGRWYHIELPDGKTGWIRASQAELI